MFIVCSNASEVMALLNVMPGASVVTPTLIADALTSGGMINTAKRPVGRPRKDSAYVRDDTDPKYTQRHGDIAQTIRAMRIGETKNIKSKTRPYPAPKDARNGYRAKTHKIPGVNLWEVTRIA